MRLLDTGTKMVVHSTLESQHKPTFDQKISDAQFKSTFNQKFSSPHQKSSIARQKFTEPPACDKKFSNKQQTIRVKPDCNDSQRKDLKTKSNSTPAVALNIPVIDNEKPKEQSVIIDKCKKLEDLMSNLSVSGRESKTRGRDADAKTKIIEKENVLSENTEPLDDSFQKLNISGGKNEKLVRKVKKEKDEEGELIERGPAPSSRKLQPPAAHPYKMSIIPQSVEEISNSGSVYVTMKETEETITPENTTDILNEENFISFITDWISEIEQCDDSITCPSTVDIQLPLFSESIPRNTSPHCSMDSTYDTLSPDSNVVSPMSYASPTPSPVYRRNEFTHETLLDEIATSSSSSSDYLPNEPAASSDLFDLIEGYLDSSKNNNESQQINNKYDFVVLDKPNVVGNKTQQHHQFYSGVSQTNSVVPQVLPVVNNNKLTQDMSHDNTVATHILDVVSNKMLSEMPFYNSVAPHIVQTVNNKSPSEMSHTNTIASDVNANLSRVNIVKPLNVAYNVTEDQFNIFTASNVVTTAPPEHVIASLTSTNHVQPNIMNHQTIYIPAKSSNQIPFNIPVVNTASQSTCKRNVVPIVEANLLQTNKPDNSVVSFICGDSTKNNISKSVPINIMTRFNTTPSSVRPVERQILPAGPEVYETGMSVPASVRLKSLMKSKDFTVQYVKVCHDLVNRPELLKERLFRLLTELPKAQNWLICIYAHIALTVSIQSKAAMLTATNSEGRSLLYLACVNHPDQPVIARYIADSLLDLNINPDEIYDISGNSLVHLMALLGDSHVAVLAELLNVRHPLTGQPVFNVNKPNYTQLETPLHVAVSKHSLPHNCLGTVKLLITHGANVAAQDKKGMTPLHYAVRGNCELKIVTLLLQSPTSHAALDITNSEYNSALHLAAANNDVSLLKQKAVILSLIGHGANYKVQNIDGKVPVALVSIERLQEIKTLFHYI